MSDLDRFARPLPPVPGTTVSDEPMRLDPEVEAEVRERIREIEECRAAAMVSAQRYVIL